MTICRKRSITWAYYRALCRKYIAAGNKKSSIKTLETYVKIEDNTAYYVVNSNYRGHVVLD